jgi:hypothetical protein
MPTVRVKGVLEVKSQHFLDEKRLQGITLRSRQEGHFLSSGLKGPTLVLLWI